MSARKGAITEREAILFSLLCFQPYLGIALLPSDIQPFAVIYAGYLMNKYRLLALYKINFIPGLMAFLALTSIAVHSLLFSAGEVQIVGGSLWWVEQIRVFWGYITPLFIITIAPRVFSSLRREGVDYVFRWFVGMVIVGYLLNIFGLTWLIQLFVNRAIYEGLDSARGLTGFFPEQSRVSEQLSFLLIFLVVSCRLSAVRLIVIILIGGLSFAGQFFLSVVLGIISLLAAFAISLLKRGLVSGVMLIAVTFPIVIIVFAGSDGAIETVAAYAIDQLGLPARGLDAFRTLVTVGSVGFASDHGVIVKLSGVTGAISALWADPLGFWAGASLSPQLLSDIGAYHARVENMLFGNTQMIGFDRPYGALGTYIIDFRIIGLVAVGFITAPLISTVVSPASRTAIGFSVLFLFAYMWLKVPLVNPALWYLYGILASNAYNLRLASNASSK